MKRQPQPANYQKHEPPVKKQKAEGGGPVFKYKEGKPFEVPSTFQEEAIPVLQDWDPQNEEHRLPPGFLVILEGSRRIGKSVFLKWLLQFYIDQFDLAIVLSETAHNGYWQPVVGNKWVHEGWNPYLVMKLLEAQVVEKKREQDSNGRHKMRRVLLILDDIIGDKRHIHEDTELNRIAVQGRHFGVSVCLTTQDAKAINPTLRNNADLAVIFQQKNFRAKESIYNDFINIFDKKQQAVEMLRRYTHDHDCVVVECTKLNEIPKKLYFHVAGETTFDETKGPIDKVTGKPKGEVKAPDYQLGSDEQKRLAKTRNGKLPLFLGVKD